MLHFLRIGRSRGEVNAVPAPARPGSRRGARRRERSPHIEVLETRLTPSGIPTMIQISSSGPLPSTGTRWTSRPWSPVHRGLLRARSPFTVRPRTPTARALQPPSPWTAKATHHLRKDTRRPRRLTWEYYDFSAVYLPDPSSDFAGSVTAQPARVTYR